WADGRLGLTGDAAHPMLQYLAQGACQAIEDAACLAHEAAAQSSPGEADWRSVLKGYERRRTERTARVQSSARVWGDLWHVDGLARLLRNELFRDRQLNDFKHVDWLYGA
ncbi:FAD-dependent monooxygenase, partial [Streptomyces albiflaviniger]|nr:FAD-dependent monooxygenase [Streptomyces albiflaviniger]